MKIAVKNLINRKEGLTLIEVLIALTIFLIIAVSFLRVFVFSTSVNRKSEDILDATYIAQSIIEERYAESKDGGPIPDTSGTYLHPSGYLVRETIQTNGNLVRIIVKIYSDASENQLEAQMETYFLWNSY